MKILLSFILCFVGATLSAQESQIANPLTYSEVIHVDGVSADELFTKGRAWFATAYNDSKSVLQMAENSRLIGKAVQPFSLYGGFAAGNLTVRVTYNLSIECRDGRYKYTINNVVARSSSGWANFGPITIAENYKEKGAGAKTMNKLWKDLKSEFSAFQLILITSLKEAMNNNPRQVAEEDW